MNKSFEINKNIYLIEVLLQGIEDFSELWKISYDNEILLIEWENEKEIDNIFNEFINYITWLINEL